MRVIRTGTAARGAGGKVLLILGVWSADEVGGIGGGAVKCLDITKNTD